MGVANQREVIMKDEIEKRLEEIEKGKRPSASDIDDAGWMISTIRSQSERITELERQALLDMGEATKLTDRVRELQFDKKELRSRLVITVEALKEISLGGVPINCSVDYENGLDGTCEMKSVAKSALTKIEEKTK